MKRLMIVVEGKTEEEFVKEILKPYFYDLGFYNISAIKIQTRKGYKGGFVNYAHLKNDVLKLLHEPNTLVTTFVDYFRVPTSLPNFNECSKLSNVTNRIACLENSIKADIGFEDRFIPYIQQHEFESLLFSRSQSFAAYYDMEIVSSIEKIIEQYDNPEDINEKPSTSPSNRLLVFIPNFKKATDGILIALETGIEIILEKCPHFRTWIERLVKELDQ